MKKILFLFASLAMLSCSSDDTDTVVDDPVEENPGNPENPEACVYSGTVVLETQAEVNAFATRKFCKIDGSLFIRGNVTSLAGLENLKEVREDVNIDQANNLTSLSGLNGLEKARRLVIENNAGLIDFSGLDSFKTVESFTVTNNLAIKNFEGLQSLTSIRLFNVSNNNQLINLEGFSGELSITSIGLTNNVLLSSVGHLALIKPGFSLSINNSPLLSTLDGLGSVNGLGYLSIKDCGFTSLPGLKMKEGGELFISGIAFTSLAGIENIQLLNQLLLYNTSLTTLVGLAGINKISVLRLVGNANLVSLDGLEGLTHVGILNIENCPALTSLQALSSLTTFIFAVNQFGPIDPSLAIINTGVTSLDGLENVRLNNPPYLNIYIRNNGNLENLCALQPYFTNGANDTATISGNLYNPTKEDIIAGNCSQ